MSLACFFRSARRAASYGLAFLSLLMLVQVAPGGGNGNNCGFGGNRVGGITINAQGALGPAGVVEAHGDEGEETGPHAVGVDRGVVAGDDPVALEAADALRERRGREPGGLAQGRPGGAAVPHQELEDLPVNRIHCFLARCRSFLVRTPKYMRETTMLAYRPRRLVAAVAVGFLLPASVASCDRGVKELEGAVGTIPTW